MYVSSQRYYFLIIWFSRNFLRKNAILNTLKYKAFFDEYEKNLFKCFQPQLMRFILTFSKYIPILNYIIFSSYFDVFSENVIKKNIFQYSSTCYLYYFFQRIVHSLVIHYQSNEMQRTGLLIFRTRYFVNTASFDLGDLYIYNVFEIFSDTFSVFENLLNIL